MVVGIAMVKDEADIIGHVISHMLGQVDALIVADNMSTDGTREILEGFAGDGVTVLDDDETAYYQSRKMSALAALADDLGACWVVPFDADEWIYSPFGRVGDVLMEQREASMATSALFDHIATGIDPEDPNPIARMRWRRPEPAPLPKIACRPSMPVTIDMGNHGARYGHAVEGLLVTRHFPYRSVEQVVRKIRNGAAAYKASELPDHYGSHWRKWGQILDAHGEDGIAELFRRWHWVADPTSDRNIGREHQPALVFDPCLALSL